MQKIEALNSLEVIDWSCGGSELEYVLVENNEHNHRQLIESGFTESEIWEACDDGRTEIDLSYLAFNFTDANYWTMQGGFCKLDTPIDEDL